MVQLAVLAFCEAYAWMRGQGELSAADYEQLQKIHLLAKRKSH